MTLYKWKNKSTSNEEVITEIWHAIENMNEKLEKLIDSTGKLENKLK